MRSDEIAIKTLALVPDLVQHILEIIGGGDVWRGPLNLRLAAGAPEAVLAKEDEQDPCYPIHAGFVGAGAILACAWVSLGTPGPRETLIELSVGPLTAGLGEGAPVGADQCQAMFRRGFEWFMAEAGRSKPMNPATREV